MPLNETQLAIATLHVADDDHLTFEIKDAYPELSFIWNRFEELAREVADLEATQQALIEEFQEKEEGLTQTCAEQTEQINHTKRVAELACKRLDQFKLILEQLTEKPNQ